MSLKCIRNARLADQVAYQLKQSLFTGKYKEGERLPPEHELVEILGVSRVVVREAIRNMEKAGLVEIRRGATGGAFVDGAPDLASSRQPGYRARGTD